MLTVYRAGLADLEMIVPLFDRYRQFYGRVSDPEAAYEFLRSRLDRQESLVFVAHDANGLVGFTQLYPSFSSVSMARIFILNDLFVDEGGRRKGVAGLLISAAIQYAKAHGAVRLMLSTATTNIAAQALYQSAGWQRDEAFIYYQFPLTA
jgi:GNAT superfamily N-acetyltransferase